MDYRRTVANVLSNYKYIKVGIENLKFSIQELEPQGLHAIDYEGKIMVQNSEISSVTENEAIKLADRRTKLENELRINEAIIIRIDKCVEALPRKHRIIVQMKYQQCLSWAEINRIPDLCYSVSHCKRMNTWALKKIAIGLYGVNAVQDK